MNHSIIAGFLAAAATVAGVSPSAAETIRVSGGSIQDAINRAGAGDTVLVAPGTYSPFQITKDGITVKSEVPGGAHVVANGGDQPAIASYGQNNVAVLDFRVTSHRGDGMKIGGSPGRMASNIRVEGNTVESAWLDGIKMFQATNTDVSDNEILMSGAAGPAGKGANGNGDGGIDWVQVVNSKMDGNTVTSRGWACAMVKGGSINNEITNNRFEQCEVNGLDMAAPSTGRAGAANKSGVTAGDSTVTGNTIDGGSGGCAVRLGNDTRNIRLTGNDVAGSNCDSGNGNGAGAAGARGGSGTDFTAGDSNGIQDYETRRRINSSYGGTIGGSCAAQGAISNAASAAGGISSIFSGGRATAPLQIAQQLQLIAQRICQTEQLMTQIRMLAGMDINTVDDVLHVLRRLDPLLRRGDLLLTDGAIMEALQEAYPEAFPEGTTYGDMKNQQIIWNERTRRALDTKSRIENSVIQQQQAALDRAGRIEQAGRDSGGIRGAQLATNGLLMEVMGSLNNQITVQTAHQRALAEVQYRQEAERAAAERDAKDFMSTLGNCPKCGQTKINLFGGADSGAVGVGSNARGANNVFGTGTN